MGLDYLPDDIKRPVSEDKMQELVIPLDYVNAEWLPTACPVYLAVGPTDLRTNIDGLIIKIK